MVSELFLHLSVALKDVETAPADGDLDVTDESAEAKVVACTKMQATTLLFLLNIGLTLARAHASMPNRIFPLSIMTLLVRLVNTSQSVPTLQFPLLVILGDVLKLDNHRFDATHTISDLLATATLLYDAESSSRGEKSYSPALQAFTALSLTLADKFKSSDIVLPPWFQAINEFREVLAFVRRGTPVVTPDLLTALRGSVSSSEFKRLHDKIVPGFDEELVEAVSRYEESNGSRVAPPKEQRALFATLKNASDAMLSSRITVLNVLADRFWKVVPFCNILLPAGSSALTDQLLQARSLVFWATKKSQWQSILSSTKVRYCICPTSHCFNTG